MRISGVVRTILESKVVFQFQSLSDLTVDFNILLILYLRFSSLNLLFKETCLRL